MSQRMWRYLPPGQRRNLGRAALDDRVDAEPGAAWYLPIVRGFVNSSSNTACRLVVGGTIVPVTHREENYVVPIPLDRRENRGICQRRNI